ncbi:hypothetical protein CVV68_01330 [Arthrobacter livingstonensis]|uniref:Asp23/Gls24 family envelope stress response protein n=1 Tax=Arthrobacter livingstonensis TaxID=670078 RepID=A0A2V5LE43_9MICC|nr:Asp23/Gls24 family envelope stress response protein [Arthrobacter livingstonensis]PYI69778.1 hypothetical protein CVV68_01330 [Arthrobacter livingstonensis]
MSDPYLPGSLINSQLIASLAARTALETPGVLRLEPTLEGFLARLGPAALRSLRHPGSQDGSYRHDGVTATINDGTARVDLDIATDIAYTALTVAEAVQQRIHENISHTGLTPGRIHIHILSIEPRPE